MSENIIEGHDERQTTEKIRAEIADTILAIERIPGSVKLPRVAAVLRQALKTIELLELTEVVVSADAFEPDPEIDPDEEGDGARTDDHDDGSADAGN